MQSSSRQGHSCCCGRPGLLQTDAHVMQAGWGVIRDENQQLPMMLQQTEAGVSPHTNTHKHKKQQMCARGVLAWQANLYHQLTSQRTNKAGSSNPACRRSRGCAAAAPKGKQGGGACFRPLDRE